MRLPLRRWVDRFDEGEIEAAGDRVDLGPDRTRLDELAERVATTADPVLRARLRTTDGLVVKLVPGWVVATLAAGAEVRVHASGRGGPGRAVLDRPLVVTIEGAPLALRAAGMELLLGGASLSPDGRVELRPHGEEGARRLTVVSRVLSTVVRRKPAVRRWLSG
jgi:hypothetical protein